MKARHIVGFHIAFINLTLSDPNPLPAISRLTYCVDVPGFFANFLP